MSYFGISDYCFTNLKSFSEPTVRQRVHRPHADREARTSAFQTVSGADRRTGFAADRRLYVARREGDRGRGADRTRIQRDFVFRSVDAEHRLLDAVLRFRPERTAGLEQFRSQRHGQPDQSGGQVGRFPLRGSRSCLLCLPRTEGDATDRRTAGGKTEKAGELGVRAALLADKINTIFGTSRTDFITTATNIRGTGEGEIRGRIPAVVGGHRLPAPRRTAGQGAPDQSRRVLDRVSDSLLRQDRTPTTCRGISAIGAAIGGVRR